MPTASIARQKYLDLLNSIGRAGVHGMFPNDFEYYAIALEVVDSNNETEDLLIFPILPDEFTETNTAISNIKKSSSGVISLFNPTFVPGDIRIGGNFGRKFRVLLGDQNVTFSGIKGVLNRNKRTSIFEPPEFDLKVKTGYGTLKVLEGIYYKSFKLDNYNKPYKVYFHNLALNNSYLVELTSFSTNMDSRVNNMMWAYSLQMTTLAPAGAVRPNYKLSLLKILIGDNVSKALTTTADLYTGVYNGRINRLKIR